MPPPRPPLAMLPVLLLLGVLGAGAPRAVAAPVWPPRPPSESMPPIEVEPGTQTCDGLWAHGCDEGMRCVDDPSDACDGASGDSDCPGLCVEPESTPAPLSCRLLEPQRSYISREPPLCALLLFTCGAGKQPFSDDCGCGCEPTP